MLKALALYLILGKPLVMYIGILTLLSFFFTASIAILNRRGIRKLPFRFHPKMARLSLLIGSVHALLALSLFL